jgi:hypothetical protein
MLFGRDTLLASQVTLDALIASASATADRERYRLLGVVNLAMRGAQSVNGYGVVIECLLLLLLSEGGAHTTAIALPFVADCRSSWLA